MILLFNSYTRRCWETDIDHHLTDKHFSPDWVPQCIVVVSALCPSLWPSALMSLPPTTLKPVLASWLLDVWSTHERYATHNISYTSCVHSFAFYSHQLCPFCSIQQILCRNCDFEFGPYLHHRLLLNFSIPNGILCSLDAFG